MSAALHTLYAPQAGGRVLFSRNGNRIIVSEPWDNDEEDCAAIQIDPAGMRVLAARLAALADKLVRKDVKKAGSK